MRADALWGCASSASAKPCGKTPKTFQPPMRAACTVPDLDRAIHNSTMTSKDKISLRWFDPSTVTVVLSEGAAKILDVFSAADLALLSGAFSQSTVEVTLQHGVIFIRVAHQALVQMDRELFFNGTLNAWALYNTKFKLNPVHWGKDLAARSLSIQASAAQALGIPRISARAVGDFQTAQASHAQERSAGYWVWPRLGFDGPIPLGTQLQLPDSLKHCQLVSELLATDRGLEFWYRYGETVGVRFDTTLGSGSWKTLSLYKAKRDIRI